MSAIPANGNPVALPENVQIEAQVLGACMAWPDAVEQILAACCPDDFYSPPHPAIAAAIVSLHAEGSPVTPLMVSTRFAHKPAGDFDIRAYLNDLCEMAPALGSVPLARSLADMRLRREGIIAAQDAQEMLASGAVGLLDSLRPVMEIADRAAAAIGKRTHVPIREASDAMLRSASDRAAGRGVVAATTGVNLLDEAIGGLQGGDLIVLAGRPGMGKSALLMTTALRSAMEGRPVLFFSLEMTQERLLQRAGCDLDYDQNAAHPLSYSWFRNGTAKHEDVARLGEALNRLPESLTIFENGSLDIHEIAALSRAHAARANVMGVIVIDYLQKVNASDRYKGNRVQEVTEISGAAKALAMRLKWPVVVGAQLNRGVESKEDKRPGLTDLRESGAIEQDADAVIGLYRPAYYIEKRKPALGAADPGWKAWQMEWDTEKNRLDLLVLKNRNGAEDSLSVFCDMRASAIRNDAPRGAR
jgi:replicative DNA helicase